MKHNSTLLYYNPGLSTSTVVKAGGRGWLSTSTTEACYSKRTLQLCKIHLKEQFC